MKKKEQLQKLLENKIDDHLLDKIPSGYSRIGDIAILHQINKELQPYSKILGDAIIQSDPQINVVVEQLETRTIFRTPQIIFLAGDKRFSTVHKEYNTIFHIDISKITFSPGNKGEREHLMKRIKDNEVICDMFACIGNLSLPIVVNNPTVKAYGIELNQEAYNFLELNIKENKVEKRYYPIYGDNREKTPKNFATRVLMGYFGSDEKQFFCALKAIKEKGWVHYHSTATRNKLDESKDFVKQIAKKIDYDIEIREIRKVKKFSPRLYHLCTDIHIEK